MLSCKYKSSMKPYVVVDEIKIYKVEKADDGLVAFASCVLDGKFFLNGVAIYKKMTKGYRITFPKRRDSKGNAKDIFVPINSDAYNSIAVRVINKYLNIYED